MYLHEGQMIFVQEEKSLVGTLMVPLLEEEYPMILEGSVMAVDLSKNPVFFQTLGYSYLKALTDNTPIYYEAGSFWGIDEGLIKRPFRFGQCRFPTLQEYGNYNKFCRL